MLEQYKQTKSLLGDKVELRLLADEDVKVAIAMNEKIAGIRKERWIVTLDSQVMISIFINGAPIFSLFIGTEQKNQ